MRQKVERVRRGLPESLSAGTIRVYGTDRLRRALRGSFQPFEKAGYQTRHEPTCAAVLADHSVYYSSSGSGGFSMSFRWDDASSAGFWIA
jgi:hypothetical protein